MGAELLLLLLLPALRVGLLEFVMVPVSYM
jgi:hypothetical protein